MYVIAVNTHGRDAFVEKDAALAGDRIVQGALEDLMDRQLRTRSWRQSAGLEESVAPCARIRLCVYTKGKGAFVDGLPSTKEVTQIFCAVSVVTTFAKVRRQQISRDSNSAGLAKQKAANRMLDVGDQVK